MFSSLTGRHDEVRPQVGLVDGLLDARHPPGLDALQEPRHVLGERAHGLQPLLVPADVVRGEAVDLVPVLRGDQRHVADCEVLVQAVEGRGSPAPAAGHDGGSELSGHPGRVGIEEPVRERADLTRRASIVHRRAQDDGVELVQPLRQDVDVVPDRAPSPLGAVSAVPASSGVVLDMVYLRLDTLLVEGVRDLLQGCVGAAVLLGATVDE